MTDTLQHWQPQCPCCMEKERGKKMKKEPWECSCAADLPFKKFWGYKYSNDSSVPLHRQLNLTRGPNVECQQQTQRSELWGAKAASAAWLNGAGDCPSPLLPSRHSQSLLGKGAPSLQVRQQVSGRTSEGAGVYLGPYIIHMHRYGTKTSTKERPQVPSAPTCFQSIIDGNSIPYTFP